MIFSKTSHPPRSLRLASWGFGPEAHWDADGRAGTLRHRGRIQLDSTGGFRDHLYLERENDDLRFLVDVGGRWFDVNTGNRIPPKSSKSMISMLSVDLFGELYCDIRFRRLPWLSWFDENIWGKSPQSLRNGVREKSLAAAKSTGTCCSISLFSRIV